MAHESFEDAETAKLMNELFVNIKVDREERPDLDSIYMQAVQALTGQGGWPMTVFLTPEGVPFSAAHTIHPRTVTGMPSFQRVMQSVADAYTNRRDAITSTSEQLRQIYDTASSRAKATASLNAHTLELAYRSHAAAVRHPARWIRGRAQVSADDVARFPAADTGSAPARATRWRWSRETFRKMSRGGIYDQIGGGFHRYTVDAIWLVPHFEKMLYDNALLVRLGAHLWQATKDPEVRRVTEETVTG